MFGFDSNDSPRPSGLLARGKAILSVIVRMFQNRLELVATEIQEEYERLWPLLVQTLVCLILLSFGLLFLSIFIIVLFWDTNRLLALGVVAGAYLLTGALWSVHVHGLWKQRSKLFSTTLAELEKDLQSLQD
jgi:uncharacterized membrane protein YqjE